MHKWPNETSFFVYILMQKKVRKKPGDPEVSKFPVHMDWNKAEVNKVLVETKFGGYVKSKFPGYAMPKEMVTFFIEVKLNVNTRESSAMK